jgi:uncharacterized protein YecA (UPF0149 family)
MSGRKEYLRCPGMRERIVWHPFHIKVPGATRPIVWRDPKIGRNNPCACVSGRKYKKCCLN